VAFGGGPGSRGYPVIKKISVSDGGGVGEGAGVGRVRIIRGLFDWAPEISVMLHSVAESMLRVPHLTVNLAIPATLIKRDRPGQAAGRCGAAKQGRRH